MGSPTVHSLGPAMTLNLATLTSLAVQLRPKFTLFCMHVCADATWPVAKRTQNVTAVVMMNEWVRRLAFIAGLLTAPRRRFGGSYRGSRPERFSPARS